MRVLVCGGQGFLGREVCHALQREGHEALARSRHTVPALDFVRYTNPSDWLPHLAGIDAVVNTVGALRDTPKQPLAALHTQAPIALFDACVQAGVPRVVQVSALGVDASETCYARSKKAADTHLLNLHAQGKLQAVVVRPSIIFGRGGASTQLFLKLAALPALMLPAPARHCPIQPVAVRDIAHAIAQLLASHPAAEHWGSVVELGGPNALTLGELLISLRAQMDHRPAVIADLPQWLSVAAARVGDRIPAMPWCSESMALLQTPNVCNPAALHELLEHPPVAPHALYASLSQENVQ